MSPFREAPHVELGPLEVGLESAATRATRRLPRGGRLIDARLGRPPVAHGTGALGSAGLMLVGATALVAWSTGWQPSSIADLAASVPVVVFGGLSLAAVFRAVDRTAGAFVRRGELVGRKAHAVLRRLARLEAQARRGRIDPGRTFALRRAIASTADPEIAPWFPSDVRGRAELLLAREIAAAGGPAWPARAAVLREVRALLTAAIEHLDDAAPACADLAALGRSPAPRAERRRLPALPEEPAEDEGAAVSVSAEASDAPFAVRG